MSKIPTAEDYFWNKYPDAHIEHCDINKSHIEFTKRHVEAALKAVHEYYEINYDIYPFPDNEINVDTDIYPLENIK